MNKDLGKLSKQLGVALLEALAGLKETAKDLSQGNRFSVEA
jgi:hypothetical protein